MKIIMPKLILAVLIVGVTFLFLRKEIDAVIFNYTPYNIHVSCAYGSIKDKNLLVESHVLKPGQELKISKTFWLFKKDLYVYAKTIDKKLTRWVFDLEEDTEATVHFEGEDIFFNPYDNLVYKEDGEQSNLTEKFFGYEKIVDGKSSSPIHIIHDSTFSYFLSIPKDISSIDRKLLVNKTEILSRALYFQMLFENRFPKPSDDFPFHLGLSLDDINGYDYPGITVTAKLADQYIDGGKIPFVMGDEIISINGTTVFSYGDLAYHLYSHAQSLDGGIGIPIKMQLIRNQKLISIESSYFFNEGFYLKSSDEKIEALMYGMGDTFFYGKASEAISALNVLFKTATAFAKTKKLDLKTDNYKLFKWQYRQKEMRLKQFNQTQFTIGGVASMFFSPAQIFTKSTAKGIAKFGLNKPNSYKIASIGIELAEGVIWTYNTGPIIKGEKDINERIIGDIPVNLAVGILSASLSRKTIKS